MSRLLVITGDHFAPDPEKRGGRYNDEDFVTHNAMVEAFKSFDDLDVTVLNDHRDFFTALDAAPDLAVNFCDTGYFNQIELEPHVPAYLELRGINYTGATPSAIALCYDKAVVRMVAEAMGVAVPRETFLTPDRFDAPPPAGYPCLIKPNRADGSLGITKDSVVQDRDQAREYLAWLARTLPGRAALVQEYLPGPEYGLGLIGNPATGLRALPPLEVDFSRLPEGLAPILSYESKALPDSPYWTEIGFQRAALEETEADAMADSAKRLFARLGLRDYARFDFRRAADGQIKLMEVNPNPAWANDGKLAFMAGFADMAYRDLLRSIVDAAMARGAAR